MAIGVLHKRDQALNRFRGRLSDMAKQTLRECAFTGDEVLDWHFLQCHFVFEALVQGYACPSHGLEAFFCGLSFLFCCGFSSLILHLKTRRRRPRVVLLVLGLVPMAFRLGLVPCLLDAGAKTFVSAPPAVMPLVAVGGAHQENPPASDVVFWVCLIRAWQKWVKLNSYAWMAEVICFGYQIPFKAPPLLSPPKELHSYGGVGVKFQAEDPEVLKMIQKERSNLFSDQNPGSTTVCLSSQNRRENGA